MSINFLTHAYSRVRKERGIKKGLEKKIVKEIQMLCKKVRYNLCFVFANPYSVEYLYFRRVD